jgi:serine/threonine-protein kinase
MFSHPKNLNIRKHFSVSSVISNAGRIYEIEEQIGEGGHAVVHKCANDRNEYAIKFQLNRRTKAVKRFCNSIEVLKKLSHDNLLKYIDDGFISTKITIKKNGAKTKIDIKTYFMIMEIYEEGDLGHKLCKECFRYRPEQYLAQFLGLSDALAHFHKVAVHRDIKPANILIGNGRWVLADYGLCTSISGDRITGDNERVGPRLWMSPEANNKALSVKNAVIDKASDVYQMASIFWFVVNGKHPTGILEQSDWRGPKRLFLPIVKALAHDKSKRYKDGEAFHKALDSAINHNDSGIFKRFFNRLKSKLKHPWTRLTLPMN